MSLASMIKSITQELAISTPAMPTLVSNVKDQELLQIIAQIYRTIRDLRLRIEWPQLTKTATITLVNGQSNYAFPADWDGSISRTQWDDANQWEMIGPVSAQEWEFYKRGIVSTTPRRRYRNMGYTNNRFILDPVPGVPDAGSTCSFEYQSKTVIAPATWEPAKQWNASSYCWYNGNIYTTTVGGTSGSTAPTHTTGSQSDGGVTWTYSSAPYTSFIAFSDCSIIDEELVSLGAQWRFSKSKDLPYDAIKAEWEAEVQRTSVRDRGARIISLGGAEHAGFLLSPWNIPDSGYGS